MRNVSPVLWCCFNWSWQFRFEVSEIAKLNIWFECWQVRWRIECLVTLFLKNIMTEKDVAIKPLSLVTCSIIIISPFSRGIDLNLHGVFSQTHEKRLCLVHMDDSSASRRIANVNRNWSHSILLNYLQCPPLWHYGLFTRAPSNSVRSAVTKSLTWSAGLKNRT